MGRSTYIALAIITTFIWGVTFLVPYILVDVSPVAIVFGRFTCYGLIASSIILFQRKFIRSLTLYDWKMAFYFALFGHVGYFLFLAYAVHFNDISVTALIFGIVPIILMVTGSRNEKSINKHQLGVSIILILFGLVLLNGSKLHTANEEQDYDIILGIILAVGAVMTWSWYSIKNAYYLKKHTHITGSEWSNLIGLCALGQSLIGGLVYFILLKQDFYVSTSLDFPIATYRYLFIFACLFLGIVVSWLAVLMWNMASRHLPITLLGQLLVFETISSVLYEHLWDRSFPSLIEWMSMILIISGIMWGLRAAKKTQLKHIEPPA